MSQQDVENEILKPMQGIYLPPRQFTEDMVKANLLEYAAALEGFSVDDLRYAWARTRDTHSGRAWPVPGVFVAFAAKHKNDRMSSIGSTKSGNEVKKQNENWKNWERVRNLPVAQEAAQKGVSWSLKCRILSGLQPGAIDIDKMVQDRGRSERLYWKIKNDQPIWSERLQIGSVVREPMKSLVVSMYDSIVMNEAATAREIGFTGQKDAAAEPLDLEALVG